MRSFVIRALLVVLSFSAMHDIVISMIDTENRTIYAHTSPSHDAKPKAVQLSEVHNLLHYIAIVEVTYPAVESIDSSKRTSDYTFPSPSPDIGTSYKPPIA